MTTASPGLEQLPAACCAALAKPAITSEEAAVTAKLFKALSDPQRVRIVNLLANSREAVCVCDLTGVIGLSQPTVSFHLKKLVASGLVEHEHRGTWGYYSLNRSALRRLARAVEPKGVAK